MFNFVPLNIAVIIRLEVQLPRYSNTARYNPTISFWPSDAWSCFLLLLPQSSQKLRFSRKEIQAILEPVPRNTLHTQCNMVLIKILRTSHSFHISTTSSRHILYNNMSLNIILSVSQNPHHSCFVISKLNCTVE